MSTDGVAIGVAISVSERPAEGDHSYVSPPVASRFTLSPSQIVSSAEMEVIKGGATTTSTDASAEQEPPLSTLTV